MSLYDIVRALGGEVYDGGRRASIPGPGHSKADRSVSLLIRDNRLVVNTFGRSGWREVLDDLRGRGLIDAHNRPLSVSGAVEIVARQEAASDAQRREAAQRLWSEGRPIPGTLAARHCRLRGWTLALPGPEALRHHPEVPVSIYRPGRRRRPALLAGVQDAAGRYVAVEVTYLAPNGRRAVDLRLPRKTVGVPPPGCAVRLAPAAPAMLVGEGVFQTRAAAEWFGLPDWALQSTRNMRAWSPPAGVASVLIAADRGKDGEASAEVLRARLVEAGITATVALPPAPWPQWDQWSLAVAGDRGGGAAESRPPASFGGGREEEGTGRVRPGAG